MVKEVQRKEPVSSTGSDNLFEYDVKKFMLGSDHDMLNDPMIGIPTVALGYWSDRYHHTNEDSFAIHNALYAPIIIFLLSVVDSECRRCGSR